MLAKKIQILLFATIIFQCYARIPTRLTKQALEAVSKAAQSSTLLESPRSAQLKTLKDGSKKSLASDTHSESPFSDFANSSVTLSRSASSTDSDETVAASASKKQRRGSSSSARSRSSGASSTGETRPGSSVAGGKNRGDELSRASAADLDENALYKFVLLPPGPRKDRITPVAAQLEQGYTGRRLNPQHAPENPISRAIQEIDSIDTKNLSTAEQEALATERQVYAMLLERFRAGAKPGRKPNSQASNNTFAESQNKPQSPTVIVSAPEEATTAFKLSESDQEWLKQNRALVESWKPIETAETRTLPAVAPISYEESGPGVVKTGNTLQLSAVAAFNDLETAKATRKRSRAQFEMENPAENLELSGRAQKPSTKATAFSDLETAKATRNRRLDNSSTDYAQEIEDLSVLQAKLKELLEQSNNAANAE